MLTSEIERFNFAGVDRHLWHAWLVETLAELPLNRWICIEQLSESDGQKVVGWANAIVQDYRPNCWVSTLMMLDAMNNTYTVAIQLYSDSIQVYGRQLC